MLGDLDLGLHLVRSQAFRAGEPLSAVTARLTAAAGSRPVSCRRPTTGCERALVTPAGTFAFQEWFVARRHEDDVDGSSTTARTARFPPRECSRRSKQPTQS